MKGIDGTAAFHLGMAEDSSDLVNSIREVVRNMVLICLGGIIVAILLTIAAAQYLLNPLNMLIKTLADISAGNLKRRFEIKKHDEIGVVGAYLNETIDTVEKMIAELDEKNEQLKKMDRIKDDFLANTSHELKTPLNGIIGLSEALVDGISGKLPDKAVSNLEMITAGGRRLLGLVNDILDFSKMKNRDIVLDTKSVDIRQISNVVLMVNSPIAEKKGIRLYNRIGGDFPLLSADENRIEQIMYNLVGNAIKFTPSGEVSISARSSDGMAFISVADTGIGIPVDKHEKIFEAFEQVDGSVSRDYGGTGLGLSITKKLVELHGGKINVRSEPGKGSVFTFSIPLFDKAAAAPCVSAEAEIRSSVTNVNECHPAEQERPQAGRRSEDVPSVLPELAAEGRRHRILVVDDEVINLQVMVDNLVLEGFDVDTVVSGQAALDAAQTNEYDLVILDVMMPRMSGYEVCRKLRETYSVFELPVLMLTAHNRSDDVELGFLAGANDYLAKPFDRQVFLRRITTLLSLKDAVRISLENARRYAAEKQQREISEALRELNNELSSELKLEMILEKLFSRLGTQIDYAHGHALIRENGSFAVFSYQKENGKIVRSGERMHPGENTLLGRILDDKRYLHEGGLRSDFFGRACSGTLSLFAVPIVYSGEVKGVLVFESGESVMYRESGLELILTMVGQAAIAVENAKLFEEVGRWTEALENSNRALESSIEELKLAQNRLVTQEKMAVLGGLVAGIAHEINTPVGVGVTAASFLQEQADSLAGLRDAGKLTDDEFRKFLATASESSRLILDNLSKTAELIKSFKMVSVDQTIDERRSFNLGNYIREILFSLKPAIGTTRHRIDVHCPDDIVIDSFPGAFSQIVTNLVMNSTIHAFDEGAEGVMSIDISRKDGMLFMRYADNGKGASQEVVSRIFDPFFTTKRNSGGTGLGTHMIYNIVTQRLKGTIECRSEEGKGIEFLIEMPL